MKRLLVAAASLLAAPLPLAAQAVADTAIRVTFGGFVDGYFAYDFNHPRSLDRSFTTQAARHDEFNVNLAFVDATLAGPRVRGRVAVQYGTSVQANYAAEPRVGTLSGPDVSRYIQEAYAGMQLTRALWVDGGVFLSPFGSESWISRDDWTYTRSYIADNSPYYESGIRATWQATPTLSGQLHLINGWQDISETNSDKALGARLDYTPGNGVDLAYDAFVGNEVPDSLPSQLRLWQEAIVQLQPTPSLGLRVTYDYGMQRRSTTGGSAVWTGWAAIARVHAAGPVTLALRVEGYHDPEQVIVATGEPYGLRVSAGSLNVDVTPAPRVLWRTEVRATQARDPVFAQGAGGADQRSTRDRVVVSSLALTF